VADGEYRFLHRDATRPPTDNPQLAVRHEPELVDANTEARYAADARRAAEARLRAAWKDAHDGITGAVRDFRAAGVTDRRVLSDLRAVERGVGRVDQRLGL